MKYIPLLALCAIPACDVVIPDTDTTPPTLTISMFDPSVTVIASSDPNRSVPRGCPPGTSANINDVMAFLNARDVAYIPPLDPVTFEDDVYFYQSLETTTKFWVTANDPEGIFSVRAVSHAHDINDPRGTSFSTRANANIPPHTGAYSEGPGTATEYGLNSPLLPITAENDPGSIDFRSNLGDVPIYFHELRTEESFVEEDDGTIRTVLKDGALLMFAPLSLVGGPIIYASTGNAADDGERERVQLAVKILPRSLCKPDT